MKYNFDEIIDRKNTGSLKWDVAEGELAMWVADMDFKTAPEVYEAITSRAEHGIFGYSTVSDEWYDAYINWWRERHKVEYAKDEMIFATGVIPIISSCVRKLTTAGENVLIMTPVYNIFFNCIKNNGRNVVEFPLDYDYDYDYTDGVVVGGYAINWEKLEVLLSDPQTTLMLLCNPHNPIGKIWDRETLSKIGEMAYDNGVTVISDEIHCDLTDPKCEYIPFASVSEKCRNNCVVCAAPTKAFNLAGIQTAAAIVPDPRLRHKVWRALNTDEVAEPNAFAIGAATAAFTKGGEWLDELRQYIYENKMLVKECLAKEIPQIKLVHSNATYLLWLDCSQLKMRSDELAEFIRKETGLYLSNGVQFGNGDNFLRMNVACPKKTVEDGLERLKKAVDLLTKA